jgi:hypothetical protein
MKLVRQYSNSEEDENVILSARDVSQASASEISDEESGVGSVQSRCLTPSGRTSCQQPFKRRKMTTRHSSQVIVSSKTLAPQPVSSICDKRQSDAWAAFAASNPSPEPPIPIEMEVPDTAQSIRYAMEGNIDGLKDLFSKGFASPRDVSITRRFSLVRVSTTTSPRSLTDNIVSGRSTVGCAATKQSSSCSDKERSWMKSTCQSEVRNQPC